MAEIRVSLNIVALPTLTENAFESDTTSTLIHADFSVWLEKISRISVDQRKNTWPLIDFPFNSAAPILFTLIRQQSDAAEFVAHFQDAALVQTQHLVSVKRALTPTVKTDGRIDEAGQSSGAVNALRL